MKKIKTITIVSYLDEINQITYKAINNLMEAHNTLVELKDALVKVNTKKRKVK